jgi:hypothetical protein
VNERKKLQGLHYFQELKGGGGDEDWAIFYVKSFLLPSILATVNSKVERDFPKAKASQMMGAEVTMVPEEKN